MPKLLYIVTEHVLPTCLGRLCIRKHATSVRRGATIEEHSYVDVANLILNKTDTKPQAYRWMVLFDSMIIYRQIYGML